MPTEEGDCPITSHIDLPRSYYDRVGHLVMRIITARLRDGGSLDQINWQRYCRDSAVAQLVSQQLQQLYSLEEITS